MIKNEVKLSVDFKVALVSLKSKLKTKISLFKTVKKIKLA